MDRDTANDLIALLPRLRRFSRALTLSDADADDLAQATVERAIDRIDGWTPGTRLDSWLYRIAQNLHFNEARRASVRRRHAAAAGDEEPSIEGGAEARVELCEVRECIDRLPPEQRQALLLVAVEGYGYAEAAQIAGAPVGTITSRLARAREALAAMRNGEGRTR